MVDLPEVFRHDEEEDENDGTGVGGANDPALLAQQSVYGMLAATQSKANFAAPFQQDSGSESEVEEQETDRKRGAMRSSTKDRDAGKMDFDHSLPRRVVERGGKLAKSVYRPPRQRADSENADPMAQSMILPPRKNLVGTNETPPTGRSEAPILDRKLQAMAEAQRNSTTSLDSTKTTEEGKHLKDEKRKERPPKSLPHVIANIFQFPEPEEVVSEYPCWYLQNVLLQGYMYITNKHVCFYSYLQKKSNQPLKTGHLGKQGKHSYSYKRYWFILKGDTFAYYSSSSEPYSPLGLVDLRYAISAEVTPAEEGKEAADFTVTTQDRVYYYRADSYAAARDWVKQLQKIIFRSHNEGDAVKISLPIENILDVEQTGVVDFAETIKLRVMASDETFAVDEYFFTFFSFAGEAVQLLRSLIGDNGAKQAIATGGEESSPARDRSKWAPPADQPSDTTPSPRRVQETARAPISLGSTSRRISPRLVSDGSRSKPPGARKDQDNVLSDSSGRDRSASNASSGDLEEAVQSIGASTESFVTPSEHQSESTNDDLIEADMSGSQMLTGDALFRGSTMRRPQTQRTATAENRSPLSTGSSRDASVEGARVEPTAQSKDEGRSCGTAEIQGKQSQPSQAPGRLVRGISTPIQQAMNVAGMVRSSSKRMSSYLSSSPKTYIDNWSTAIAGGKRHYADIPGLAPDDSIQEPEQDLDIAEHERRFRAHFGLPATENLVAVFYCWIHKTVPLYGKIYMGTRRFCFRSLWYGTKTKIVLPFKDIINVQKQRGFRWGYPGMILVIRGHEELFFDFPSIGLRDDAVVTILRHLETEHAVAESTILTREEQLEAEDAAAENALLLAARKDETADHEVQAPSGDNPVESGSGPVVFDDMSASMLDFNPKKSMHITCLTIGSRGDVQPYIALCKGLLAEGHKPTIATHGEFKDWIESHGVAFEKVEGNPADLMKLCVEYGAFTPQFLYEANKSFRPWLDALLMSSWRACQGAELLIESPSAMGGIHIAEALEIPYFRGFSMPWTRTRAYPHAFTQPGAKMGGAYNYMTYTFFDNIFWQMTAGQINRWRGKALSLGPTSLDKLQQNKVPFLYNFSPSVVAPPLDFSDWIKVTGYWFLDEGDDWQPPADLAAFIKKARDDGQKLVYIGFGSVTVEDSKQLTRQIIEAVEKADVRCILAKGWSDRFSKDSPGELPIDVPPSIHAIRSAPHDWLFKQIDAVVHHGGAGTTGASLRAGKPTIIRPFFGDQYFFAQRVEDLGVGIQLKKLTSHQLGRALWIATHDVRMRDKARRLGNAVRAEDGVATAISALYRDLDYARSLIKRRGDRLDSKADGDDTEENWTFIELDSTEADFAEAIVAASRDAQLAREQQRPPATGAAATAKGKRSLKNMVMRGRE